MEKVAGVVVTSGGDEGDDEQEDQKSEGRHCGCQS